MALQTFAPRPSTLARNAKALAGSLLVWGLMASLPVTFVYCLVMW